MNVDLEKKTICIGFFMSHFYFIVCHIFC